VGALAEGSEEEVRDWVLGRGSCSARGMGGPMVDGGEGVIVDWEARRRGATS